MEKGTPHCKLAVVKALVDSGKVRSTFTALSGAAALGLDFDGMIGVINALNPEDFYKSMTTHADHRLWQDVYRPLVQTGHVVYLKLMVVDGVLIVSFKEL